MGTRALYSAATGLRAQQEVTDLIANNLANVNTTGYKRVRGNFQDLLYQTVQLAGTPSAVAGTVPAGVQFGHGATLVSTERLFEQGSFRQTNQQLHMAIDGNGLFQILLPDGRTAYTRDGSFQRDANGQIVTHDGNFLQPAITLDPQAINIDINPVGVVTQQLADGTLAGVGNVELAIFPNPAGLQALGQNLFLQTEASGAPLVGAAGADGRGFVRQGFLEISNVNIAEELVDLIVAQRSYEVNSKSIQTQDSILGIAANLKR
jgi:flagellar basal-body rod protein FlgG